MKTFCSREREEQERKERTDQRERERERYLMVVPVLTLTQVARAVDFHSLEHAELAPQFSCSRCQLAAYPKEISCTYNLCHRGEVDHIAPHDGGAANGSLALRTPLRSRATTVASDAGNVHSFHPASSSAQCSPELERSRLLSARALVRERPRLPSCISTPLPPPPLPHERQR